MIKNLPAMQKTYVQSLGWKDSLEEGMTTHYSILAWRIPIERESWQATVHRVAKSLTWVSWATKYSQPHVYVPFVYTYKYTYKHIYAFFFYNNHSNRYALVSHCAFAWISLMLNDKEHLSMYLLTINKYSSEKCLFRFYDHLKKIISFAIELYE